MLKKAITLALKSQKQFNGTDGLHKSGKNEGKTD